MDLESLFIVQIALYILYSVTQKGEFGQWFNLSTANYFNSLGKFKGYAQLSNLQVKRKWPYERFKRYFHKTLFESG